MNKKLYFGLSIFAVAFAFVIGFGAINDAKAMGDSYNVNYGQTNLFAVDEAHNAAGVLSNRDMDSNHSNRGLPGFSEER